MAGPPPDVARMLAMLPSAAEEVIGGHSFASTTVADGQLEELMCWVDAIRVGSQTLFSRQTFVDYENFLTGRYGSGRREEGPREFAGLSQTVSALMVGLRACLQGFGDPDERTRDLDRRAYASLPGMHTSRQGTWALAVDAFLMEFITTLELDQRDVRMPMARPRNREFRGEAAFMREVFEGWASLMQPAEAAPSWGAYVDQLRPYVALGAGTSALDQALLRVLDENGLHPKVDLWRGMEAYVALRGFVERGQTAVDRIFASGAPPDEHRARATELGVEVRANMTDLVVGMRRNAPPLRLAGRAQANAVGGWPPPSQERARPHGGMHH